MTELTKKYQFQDTEKKWQNYWTEKKIYQWDNNQPRDNNYVIDTPPPTVSGMLHMGHVFSYVQADFIARFQRMKGKTIYYPMGFDDNGLPTERLVEKVNKVKASQIDRAKFINLCKNVSASARKEFKDLFQSIALSIDWHEEYHTISDRTRQISQMSFLDLHNKNLTERKLEPCYFDVVDQTALSQADIEDKELKSHMNDITFTLENNPQTITIATTRPELIAACVAVFVHPNDSRYKNLIGKNAITALFQDKVPIIADDKVDQEKGTGAVMCCSFGDMTDVMWWKKHQLASKIIINKYGKIINLDLLDFNLNNKTAYKKLQGKKVTEAREEIITILKQENLLTKQQEISHPVKCAERSGAPIEILLTKQWFIKILDKKAELLQQANQINWHPKHMKIRIEQWINGLSYDWCISRQRYFGVPFPVWYINQISTNSTETYSNNTQIIIAQKEDLPVNPLDIKDVKKIFEKQGYHNIKATEMSFTAEKEGQLYNITPEKDVMDTWATSSISPQISSGAINKEYYIDDYHSRHKKLFPADLRPQAHEIIRSWAFYTITKAYLHEKTIPWNNIMISGWCLASDKTKMSKSKGNVITPLNLIQQKGTDVVRYWAANSQLGSDTAYSEDVLTIGKKLINKLWNAAKFCMIHLDNIENNISSPITDMENNYICYTTDIWILSKLSRTIKKCEDAFEQYQYAKAIEYTENFFWHFCDNYLEIVKTRAYGDIDNLKNYNNNITEQEVQKGKISSAHTIFHILETILKLFAPFIPHITEELYSIIFLNKHNHIKSIHSQSTWPDINHYPDVANTIAQGQFIVDVIELVRKEKSNKNLSLKTEILLLEIIKNNDIIDINNDIKNDLASVCNTQQIKITNQNVKNINITLKFKN